jgi:hypothetical protein
MLDKTKGGHLSPDDLRLAAQIFGARGGAKGKGRPLTDRKRAAVLKNLEKARLTRRVQKGGEK